MMAAVAPGLRPLLLRALRTQTLRGPPWPRRTPLGPSSAPRTVTTASSQALPLSTVAQNPPEPGQNPPEPGQTPVVSSQNPPDPVPNLPGLPDEVRLEDLGLGAATPVGLIQNFLEFLHLDVGLPWWGAIAVGTLGVRLSLLPLLIRAQREASHLSTHLPQLQRLSQRLAEARRGSDQAQVARAYSELVRYQQKHNVNPLRGFLVPLVQTPLFVSFFLALQKMAAAPVPGLQTGGWGWVQDLTAPDPFYVLPLLVTASTWLVLEIGADSGVSTPSSGLLRLLLRFLPLLFLPFILHFPSAVFTYWLTSNAFSLGQASLLRLGGVRARLGFSPPPPPPNKGTPKPGGTPRRNWGCSRD